MNRDTACIATIEAIIPRPPADVAPLRAAFGRTVSKQWEMHVGGILDERRVRSAADFPFAKGRFIGEMYARACYSMLLVGSSGPAVLRIPVRASALLPQSRRLTIRLGGTMLACMGTLLPTEVHRRLLLTSAMMGMFDVVLDNAVSSGEAAALRVASLVEQSVPDLLSPEEQLIATLANAAREGETAWQKEYWERILQPAVRTCCRAEVLAVKQTPDDTGMGHRWAGIEAAIKGMWYVVGPLMGLRGDAFQFDKGQWNREQQWMADTSLLMQMIDDWVDQDEDRGTRLTPVGTGDWTPQSVAALYDKTVQDLATVLDRSGIRTPVLRGLFVDLYTDYLHAATDGMRNGVAA